MSELETSRLLSFIRNFLKDSSCFLLSASTSVMPSSSTVGIASPMVVAYCGIKKEKVSSLRLRSFKKWKKIFAMNLLRTKMTPQRALGSS